MDQAGADDGHVQGVSFIAKVSVDIVLAFGQSDCEGDVRSGEVVASGDRCVIDLHRVGPSGECGDVVGASIGGVRGFARIPGGIVIKVQVHGDARDADLGGILDTIPILVEPDIIANGGIHGAVVVEHRHHDVVRILATEVGIGTHRRRRLNAADLRAINDDIVLGSDGGGRACGPVVSG